jgi:hypothetical protein
MSEEASPLAGRTRLAVGIAVGFVVAAGLLFRFWTRSGLWFDEALTVDIARLPLHAIPGALKQDGAPPLYYYLLHFWMVLFGQSSDAVRALSGLIAVATLPVAWLCGRRLGGRAVAWTTVVLLASAPFAVYFATETRMYALVMLLTGCGYLALARAVDQPRPGNVVAVAVVTAALLYTQYWAIYLVAMVGIWLVVSVWHSRRQGHPDTAPWAALVALAAGCLLFVPWVPTLVFQAQHTGTPWAPTPTFADLVNVLTGFTDNQGSTQQTGTNQGRLLAVIYFAFLALAVFGVARSRRVIELDLRTRPRARSLGFVVLGALLVALAGGVLTGTAYSARYAAVVFLPFLLLVALGTTTLLNPRVRVVTVGLAVVAGLASSAQNVTTQRTQAGAVAAAINAGAKPGDVIAFCPDQLGPAVYRQMEDPSQYDMVTFPRRTGPATVDWVDYADTVHNASPSAFAADVAQRAGTDHNVWLVWEPMYKKYGVKCELIEEDLQASATKNGGGGRFVVTSHEARYFEPMNLTEYSTPGS